MEAYLSKLYLISPELTLTTDIISCEEFPCQKYGTSFRIITEKTIFCPQGGGQQSDIGYIYVKKDISAEVKFAGLNESGQVCLYVTMMNNLFYRDDELVVKRITLRVDADRRSINMKLHSAGHFLDFIMKELSLQNYLEPGKGYHFPDGPYVEYALKQGCLPEELSQDKYSPLLSQINEWIDNHLQTKSDTYEFSSIFLSKEDSLNLHLLDDSNPSVVEKYPSILRIVWIGKPLSFASEGMIVSSMDKLVGSEGMGCPCAGTHVRNLTALKGLRVTKITVKKNVLKLSYQVDTINK